MRLSFVAAFGPKCFATTSIHKKGIQLIKTPPVAVKNGVDTIAFEAIRFITTTETQKIVTVSDGIALKRAFESLISFLMNEDEKNIKNSFVFSSLMSRNTERN